MVAIGFRATNKAVFYAVLTGEGKFNVGKLTRPAAMDEPAGLRYLRTNIRDVITEAGATAAGIRRTEGNAKQTYPERHHIEGVILELLANSTIQSYFDGPMATIGKWLDKDRSTIKSMINATEDFMDMADWDSFSNEEREAILAAAAAISKQAESNAAG